MTLPTGKTREERPCLGGQLKCQEWDLNPRSYELAPEASALDRSAILTMRTRYFYQDIYTQIKKVLAF